MARPNIMHPGTPLRQKGNGGTCPPFLCCSEEIYFALLLKTIPMLPRVIFFTHSCPLVPDFALVGNQSNWNKRMATLSLAFQSTPPVKPNWKLLSLPPPPLKCMIPALA